MNIYVTGVAGFIGFHVAKECLKKGYSVTGIDNLNDYYDVALKEARLNHLMTIKGFEFHQLDISDNDGVSQVFERYAPINKVVHLAAQAGVRYSIENPMAYVQSNLVGQVVLLEQCRRQTSLEHFQASRPSVQFF